VTFKAEPIGAPAPVPGSRAAMSRTVASSINLRLRDRLTTMASSAQFTVRGTSPALLAARVKVDPARVDEVRRQLESDPAVESVRPEARYHVFEDRIVRPSALSANGPNVPNDPYYAPQAWHYAAIGLPDAWRITTGSASVLVAVVDDGIRFDHPDLTPNLTTDGYDFVSNDQAFVCGNILSNSGDGDGYDPDPTNPMDYDCWTGGPAQFGDHGLHVAGTIGAAGNDGAGVTGINWTVRIRPVRGLGLGGGTDYDIAQAILYAAGLPADNGKLGTVQAATGARVINMSFGGGQDTPLLHNAIKAAAKAGALLVAAAGNSGSTVPLYPAAYDEVLAVSAVGPDMRLASYSSFGPKVGIAAPGGDIDTGGWSFAVASTMWDYTTNRPTYAFAAGTSMAAPHVTGVAALVLSAEPTLTAAQLRERLTTYAVDLGTPGRDDFYGAGLLNARNALTQTHAPVRPTYAALYDASTGALLKSMSLAADAKYLFKGLADGTYFVFAGEGDEVDGATAEPGLRWTSLGGSAMAPKTVTVSGAGTYGGQLTLSLPSEREPNDDAGAGNRLVLGGYAVGRLNSELDIDRYVVTLPAGEYVFQTSGWSGACGYALDADTILEVYAADGTLVGTNDDIDGNRLNYCSRVEAKLPAGTYTLAVGGYWQGTYRVMVRAR
jgi:subtilisin family serine protease